MPIDAFVEHALAHVRTPVLTSFFLFWTELARPLPLALLLAVAVLFFCAVGKRRSAYATLLSVSLSELCASSLKLFVERPRPPYALIAETTFSFPSGHAVIAFSFFALVFFLAARTTPSRIAAQGLRFIGILVASLIALSRLYLGVHYASDVLVGSLIGIVACAASLRSV